MSDEVRIRPATLQDYGRLCELLVQVDEQHLRAMPDVFRRPQGPVRERHHIRRRIEDEDSTIILAEAGQGLIGSVTVVVRDAADIPTLAPRRYAVVHSLVVDRHFRRRGIGRMLAERAEDWAVLKGATEVELNVWEFNGEAMAFYRHLGYETISRKMRKKLR